MSQSRDTPSSNDGELPIHSSGRSGRNPPLVIVSERGRHSQASRRIVRAQAARASAAQSRETRARNRGDRQRDARKSSNEGNTGQQQGQVRRIPPPSRSHSHQQLDRAQLQDPAQQVSLAPTKFPAMDVRSAVATLKPLVNWITNVLQLTAVSLTAVAAEPALALDIGSMVNNTRDGPGSAMQEISVTGGLFSTKQLPITLPRGFAALQTRISLSGPFLLLLSRSACFDYDSPGASNRSNQLLFDIVMNSATSSVTTTATSALLGSQPYHPIQEHLRIASACLAIWNCQNIEKSLLGHDSKYTSGFEAAWQEALELDQAALKDANSAEAALWAIFIISVTCGSTAFFDQQILGLLHDLQLTSWPDVRKVLVTFNYPVMTLDQRCKDFYNQLQLAKPHGGRC